MYDVIVVGARCAGSSTALLLARRGHRVLLLDRSPFPSDMVMSTHLIWQPGVAKMVEWGLGDQLASCGAPPLTTTLFDLGDVVLTGQIPAAGGVSEAYAPRRIALDQLLAEAAVKAGAELRDATTLEELRTDGDAVTGIRGRTRDGIRFDADATLVVGADGMHSAVAKAVGAKAYHTRPALQGTYFSYFSDVPVPGIELYVRDRRAVYAWQTNDDLTLVGANWTAADYSHVRPDIEGGFHQVLGDAAPRLAERVRAGCRESRFIGGSIPNYFRTSSGPGWALVGDAGYLKDPCTAQGITDALRHAQLLSDAVDDGLTGRVPMPQALADYERRRNEAALPMYEFTCSLAPLAPPSSEMAHLYGSLAGDQARTEQFFGVFAGVIPVGEFFQHEPS